MSARENIDLGGCDVYIDGRLVGATQGKCGLVYSPTVKAYRAGYPSYCRGAEITAQDAKATIGILELTSANIAAAFCDCSVQASQTDDVFIVGTGTQPAILQNIVFHKYNEGNGKHYIVKVWKAFVTSECAIQFEQNAESFIVFDVSMQIIADRAQTNPLFEFKISNAFTPPSPPSPPPSPSQNVPAESSDDDSEDNSEDDPQGSEGAE